MAHTQTSLPSPPAGLPKASRRKAWRKAGKRLLLGGAGLFAILLTVFFLLPQWISNDQGRTYVLQQLNKRMNATLAIQSWSFGWFHGATLTDVTVTLPDGGTLLTCAAVRSDLTLWGILTGNYDIGTTTLDALHLNIKGSRNGPESFAALTGEPAERSHMLSSLRTLRGSLLANAAVVSVAADSVPGSVVYSDVKMAVTIASTDAPFHVQISAPGGERSLSLNATLPPLSAWEGRRLPGVAALSDFTFSATHFPTALLCHLLQVDPRWEQSIGTEVMSLNVSNHSVAGMFEDGFSFLLRGAPGGALVDARLVLHPPAGTTATAFSLSSATPGDHLVAELNVSPPLAAALGRTNPIFRQLDSASDTLHIAVNDLSFVPSAPALSSFSARLTFPPMTFRKDGLLNDLLNQSTTTTSLAPRAQTPPQTIAATAIPLRLRLADGHFSFEPFIITFGRRQKISFQGTVSVDEKLELLATVPTTDNILGAGTVDIPITGSVDHPVLTPPH